MLGHVHIEFISTRSGTELDVRLDRVACDFNQANFENQSGTVHLVGKLILNYVKVRCVANIDLATLEGQWHIEPIAELSLANTLTK